VTVRDLTGAGTPESAWVAAGLPVSLPECDLASIEADRVWVIAPHPDDEVLGVGGFAALLAARGAQVHVVAVSDGEASHPERADELRRVRAAERTDALRRLGLPDAHIHQLHQPDGRVCARAVADALRPLLGPSDLVLSPWPGDGHPDHDACGQAVAGLPGKHLSYLVWAWHWAAPGDGQLPWDRARRVRLTPAVAAAKRSAVAAFRSQLVGPDPILPPTTLARLLRGDEVLLMPS
jgi:LmbE family N-acetylglucosaminyl deacetylase